MLHLTHVLPAGYSWWLPDGDPFALDDRYVLGAIDALRNDSEVQLDRIGNWVMYADGRTRTEEEDRTLWKEAYRRALVSDDDVLVVIGLRERWLDVRAYHVAQGGPRSLYVEWVRDPAGESGAGEQRDRREAEHARSARPEGAQSRLAPCQKGVPSR